MYRLICFFQLVLLVIKLVKLKTKAKFTLGYFQYWIINLALSPYPSPHTVYFPKVANSDIMYPDKKLILKGDC